ncbi:FtsX-like permease family protein [Ornithinimicrobium sp. LYQ103]|uniref:FtsX-like permease family protein n=1 Tax=Ornithinimicrobium sp. LYQ103 TaxID=3378796 RepID=UPI0038543F49
MTTWWGWALRRARASTGLLLTLLVLVTATTAILAGAVGYSGAASTTAARLALTGTVASEAGIWVQTRQAEDPQAQDEAARRLIDDAFRPAAITVQRTVVSEPRPAALDGELLDGRLVVLASPSLTPEDPQVDERVALVEGSWPSTGTGTGADTDTGSEADTDPVQGMLHAATAREWAVEVGDVLEVGAGETGATPVVVTGVWRPVDAEDAYWFDDPLVAAGRDEAQRGPLVVAPGAVTRVVGAPFVRWTIQPDARTIRPEDLTHLASAAQNLQSALKTPEIDVRGVTVDGDLAPTAATASRNLATASALGVIPLSVLALVTLLAVVQLARLLAETREAQAQLLVARGANRRQVLASTVAESALVTFLGAALGALLARGVLQAVPAGDGQTGTVLGVALGTGLVVLLVLTAVASLQVRRLTAGGAADLSGRTRAATALATVVLVLGAAALAWWQLRRTGSPLVARPDGTLGTDLVAGAAPALLLAAAAVVTMALLGPLSRLVEAVTGPGRGVTAHLSAAQVSRRLPVYAVPAVLTVLAVGATSISGLYAGTSSSLRDALTVVAQGADVRVTLERPPVTTEAGRVPAAYPTFTDVDGVAAAAAVWLDEEARLADVDVPLTMSHLPDLAQVVVLPDLPTPDPLVPVGPLAEGVQAPPGLDLPEGTGAIEVTLAAEVVVGDDDLTQLQESFDASVQQAVDGTFGDPLPEDEARSTTTTAYADMLEGDSTTRDWTVTLTLLDRDSGMRHSVGSEVVEVTGARVEVTGEDYAGAAVEPGGGSGALTFTLPEGAAAHRLLDVRLDMPLGAPQRGMLVPPRVEVVVDARTDTGEPLISEAVQDWGSTRLAPPEVVAAKEEEREEQGEPEVVEQIDPVTGDRFSSSDEVHVPAGLDSAAGVWTVRGTVEWHTGLLGGGGPDGEPLTIGPGLEWVDASAGPPTPPTPGNDADDGPDDGTADDRSVPLALTADAARAADLEVGDPTLLSAFGARIPATLAAIVPAVPGTLAPAAGLVDRDAMAAFLAAEDRSLPAPDEVWIATEVDAATEVDPGTGASAEDGAVTEDDTVTQLVEVLSGLDVVAGVSGPDRVGVTDATSAARLVFWVASAGAVLLAVTGIAAVAATLMAHRRPEVAVLRALGMPPAAQARSRSWELAGVVLAAVGLGLAAAWLVGRAVVPELARSTTLRGRVQLPVELSLEVLPWAALLGVGALLVVLVVLGQAALVRRQALDHDYREEIR